MISGVLKMQLILGLVTFTCVAGRNLFTTQQVREIEQYVEGLPNADGPYFVQVKKNQVRGKRNCRVKVWEKKERSKACALVFRYSSSQDNDNVVVQIEQFVPDKYIVGKKRKTLFNVEVPNKTFQWIPDDSLVELNQKYKKKYDAFKLKNLKRDGKTCELHIANFYQDEKILKQSEDWFNGLKNFVTNANANNDGQFKGLKARIAEVKVSLDILTIIKRAMTNCKFTTEQWKAILELETRELFEESVHMFTSMKNTCKWNARQGLHRAIRAKRESSDTRAMAMRQDYELAPPLPEPKWENEGQKLKQYEDAGGAGLRTRTLKSRSSLSDMSKVIVNGKISNTTRRTSSLSEQDEPPLPHKDIDARQFFTHALLELMQKTKGMGWKHEFVRNASEQMNATFQKKRTNYDNNPQAFWDKSQKWVQGEIKKKEQEHSKVMKLPMLHIPLSNEDIAALSSSSKSKFRVLRDIDVQLTDQRGIQQHVTHFNKGDIVTELGTEGDNVAVRHYRGSRHYVRSTLLRSDLTPLESMN